jgi:hypothetical protein
MSTLPCSLPSSLPPHSTACTTRVPWRSVLMACLPSRPFQPRPTIYPSLPASSIPPLPLTRAPRRPRLSVEAAPSHNRTISIPPSHPIARRRETRALPHLHLSHRPLLTPSTWTSPVHRRRWQRSIPLSRDHWRIVHPSSAAVLEQVEMNH